MHYNRWRETGDPGPAGRKISRRRAACASDGCDAPARTRGWCDTHWHRVKTYGSDDPQPGGDFRRVPSWWGDDERLRHHGWRVTAGGCWEFAGNRDRRGYGRLSGGGRRMTFAHRMAYRAWSGPLPDDALVCHECDNPPCINPAHLYLGTQGDNMGDAYRRGRTARGERQGGHVLTEEEVLRILVRYRGGGVTQRALAAEYGVTQAAVNKIVLRRNWAHITDEQIAAASHTGRGIDGRMET